MVIIVLDQATAQRPRRNIRMLWVRYSLAPNNMSGRKCPKDSERILVHGLLVSGMMDVRLTCCLELPDAALPASSSLCILSIIAQ